MADERKRPIRGLWVRNGRYYAQLTLEDEHTGQKQVRRVPLEGAATPAQAKQKLEELVVNRRAGFSTLAQCTTRPLPTSSPGCKIPIHVGRLRAGSASSPT